MQYNQEKRAAEHLTLSLSRGESAAVERERLRALLEKAEAHLDDADRNPPQRDRNPFTRRLVRAYCEYALRKAPKQNLTPLEKIAFGYTLGAQTDPEMFLRYSLECYKRDPIENQAFHHITKGFFTDVRRQWMTQHFARICPPLTGKSVVDAHCNLGEELTWMLAQVGPRGVVWAESSSSDTFDFLDYAATHGQPQLAAVRRRLGRRDDICLPEASVDVIFFLQALHDLAYVVDQSPADSEVRKRWLASLRYALRPNGCLIIVEDGRHNPLPQIKKLMALGGFHIETIIDVPDYSPGPPTMGFVLRARKR